MAKDKQDWRLRSYTPTFLKMAILVHVISRLLLALVVLSLINLLRFSSLLIALISSGR